MTMSNSMIVCRSAFARCTEGYQDAAGSMRWGVHNSITQAIRAKAAIGSVRKCRLTAELNFMTRQKTLQFICR